MQRINEGNHYEDENYEEDYGSEEEEMIRVKPYDAKKDMNQNSAAHNLYKHVGRGQEGIEERDDEEQY